MIETWGNLNVLCAVDETPDADFTYDNLLADERRRYHALVCALVDGDCLPLVSFVSNDAPRLFAVVKQQWEGMRTPVLYRDAWSLMDCAELQEFVVSISKE